MSDWLLALSNFVEHHPLSMLLLAIWGGFDIFFKFSEILMREFAAWTHRMRIYWRRIKSEPDPNVL